LLDLRYLNEKEAGQSGFVKHRPMATTSFGVARAGALLGRQYNVYRQSEEHLEYHARWLAKMGGQHGA
jgi:hypothetical protein